MHSMHQLQARNETSLHLQPPQELTPVSQESHSGSINQQEQQTNMTVLVQLDAAQPATANQTPDQSLLSVLDPVQQQQPQPQPQQAPKSQTMQATTNQQQTQQPPPPPLIIHHLVQQQQPEPHLHLLRAPCSQHEQEQPNLSQQREPEASQQHSTRSNSSSNRQQHQHQSRQQPQQQIEGIVADGGGPIVQWLLDNYEIAEGESLPRSTVYNHYLAHCRQLRLASVNAASFGKLIRSVFVGLKTRRLGTRGHSKYHYFGVRAKQHVQLEWLHEGDQMGLQESQHQQRRGAGCSSMTMHDLNQDNSNTDQGSESDSTGDCHSGRLSSLGGGSVSNNATNNNSSKRIKRLHEGALNEAAELSAYGQRLDQQGNHFEDMLESNQHYISDGTAYFSNGYAGKQDRGWSLDQYDLVSLRQHFGANNDSLIEENWPQLEPGAIERQLGAQLRSQRNCRDQAGDEDLTSLVQAFESQYKSSYKRMITLLIDFQFNEVERLWMDFWRPAQVVVGHELIHQWVPSDATTNGDNHQNQPLEANRNLIQSQSQQQQQQHLVYAHHNQQQEQMVAMGVDTGLTFNQLYQLTSQPVMVERINQIDYKLYSAIENFLMPDMLSPIPRPLINQIRLFARDIGAWVEASIKDYSDLFVTEKLKSVRAFEHSLNRSTSINHLSTSARAIWTKRSVLAQMSMDLHRIDLRDIEHQMSLMGQSKFDPLLGDESQQHQDSLLIRNNLSQPHQQEPSIVEHNGSNRQQHNEASQTNNNTTSQSAILHQPDDNIENNYLNSNRNNFHAGSMQQRIGHEHDASCMMQPAQLIQNFIHLLDDPYPANIWPDWCRNLVELRVCGQSLEEARNFILKWNFYVSLIMRELTLRSAPSLGSFQLIRLLFDEYMYYLVVMRLAQAQHKTSIQLLTSSIRFENSRWTPGARS